MNTKVMITGANGLLGQHLTTLLFQEGFEVLATGKGSARLSPAGWRYFSLDITDGPATMDFIRQYRPDFIIHAAAVTQVDRAELDPIGCWNTNVTATRFLLEAAKTSHTYIIYVSTDFIFSGSDGPYHENSVPDPVNYYGSSKLAAEKAVTEYAGPWSIIRTALVLGNAVEGTRSTLVSWVHDNLRAGKKIKVVSDQRRTPTAVEDLAAGILLIVRKKAEGSFHISGKQSTSPYEIAVFLAKKYGYDASLIEAVTADNFSQPAQRPPNTVFRIEKAENELGFQPRNLWDYL